MTVQLKAGVASGEITPAAALPLAGYGGREGRSQGVNDPLFAKALVLRDSSHTVGLIIVDLLNASQPLVDETNRQLRERGIELDTVTVAATHTHAAPYIPTPALEVHPNLPRGYDARSYTESVAATCAEVIALAKNDMRPADVRVGTSVNNEVQENRRRNPDWGARIPRGEVDPTVTAVSVQRDGGGEVVIYNYALHPVCTAPTENRISADWPGFTATRIHDQRDSVSEVLFLNGAAGDINPRNKTAVARTGEEIYDYMREIGHAVGDSVLDALAAADASVPTTASPIHIEHRELSLRIKNPGSPSVIREQLQRIENRLGPESDLDDGVADDLERERKYLVEQLAIAKWDVERLPATLTYVELGPLAYLAVPAEVLVGHGQRWKSAADVPHLLPVTYADDYVGYIPELRDLENGGYEVETCKIAPEAIRMLHDTALELITEHREESQLSDDE